MKIKLIMIMMAMFLTLLFSSTVSAAYTGQNASNYTVFSNESLNANDIATDSDGNIYVTGSTSNQAYNITNGTYTTNSSTKNTISSGDAYVAKYSSNGTLIFSTTIGGTGSDSGNGISVDKNGNIYVIGQSKSTDLPVTSNAYQKSLNGGADALIFELSADGTQLLYCSYMGGSDTYASGGNAETGNKIKVDSNGNVYIIGQTVGTDFPTNTTAFQPNTSSGMKCFVAKFDSNWNKVYSSYLGGSSSDYPYQLLPDSNGNLWITGKTTSIDFPVTSNAYQNTTGGSNDAFLTEINANGTKILYSTYFGAAGNDYGYAMTTDRQGNIYITGQTGRNNGAPNSFIPVTAGAYQTTLNGNLNAYVAKFSSNGSLVWCTFYGTGGEDPRAIVLDSQGNVYITGRTNTVSPLTYNAVQTSIIGGTYDAFVAKFNSNGTALLYGSFLGSSASDFGYGAVIDNLSNIYIVGSNFALNKIATAPDVTINQTGGMFNTTQTVTLNAINTTNSTDTIYYTTDGTDPTNSSTRITYITPIVITNTTTLKYTAVDSLGNWSPVYTETYTIDTIPPEVNITSPSNGTYLKGNVPITATASDSSNISKVVFTTSSGYTYTDSDGSDGWGCNWDTAGLADGVYTITATAYDAAGNTNQTQITVNVDNTAPVVNITSPKGSSYTHNIVSVNATASDNSNISKVVFTTSSGYTYTDSDGSDGWGCNWDTAGLADGVYTITATAYDAAGNTNQTQITVNVDNTLPIVSITNPVNGSYLHGKVPVTVTAADNVDVTKVVFITSSGYTYTDSDGSDGWGCNWDTTGLNGVYTITATAYDAAGNTNQTQISVNVDNSAPIVNVTPVSGSYNSTQVVLNASDNFDSNPVIYYSVDGGTTYNQQKTVTLNLSEGKHVIIFYAVDNMGNNGAIQVANYTIDTTAPTASASVKTGTYNTNKSITLSMSENGTIYYTTNGSTPTTSSNKYTGSLIISSTTTLKYIAVDTAGNVSPVYTQTYTIDTKAPTASASVKTGTYNTDKTVTLSMGEIGTIYYTLNGVTPTTSSKKYAGAFTITSTHTLKFIAVDAAGNKSPVYTVKYTIDKTAPKVSAISPTSSVTGVSRTKTVSIRLSENIVKGVNWSKVYIKNLKTGQKCKATIWISGNHIYISTNSKKAALTWYQVYIPASSIKDNAGSNLAVTYSFKFKTGKN